MQKMSTSPVSFEDTFIAFQHKSDRDLFLSYLISSTPVFLLAYVIIYVLNNSVVRLTAAGVIASARFARKAV